jgi:hypothetical protein
MRMPIVKEHGSWAVFILSCAAGVTAGFLTRPWETGRHFSSLLMYTILGLIFAVNSKSPLMSLIRSGKSERRRGYLLWLIFFSAVGFLLLLPFLSEGIRHFIIFFPLVLSYIALLLRGKEHDLFSELIGFALLTLSAPVVYFVITGSLSVKLYLAVLIFFSAGVFRVRLRIKRDLKHRSLMISYCLASTVSFFCLNISTLVLLPFVENIISAVWLRNEKLRTTGNVELAKGVVFAVLLGLFWQ